MSDKNKKSTHSASVLPNNDRSKTERKTNRNIPSEEAVRELRRWSELRQQ